MARQLVNYEIFLKRSLKLRLYHLHVSSRLQNPKPKAQRKDRLSKPMEAALHDYDTSWSSSTNWSIADGSLINSITFESSFAPIADSDEQDHDVHDPSAGDSTPKSPLIICPTSPDSPPCEITIAFAHKHEVRQIYVRSTARVYEIYYACKPQSSNEYLCTVRCGIAYRDEEVLRAANLDEAALAALKGANKGLNAKKLKSERSSSSNDDDWVEVKAPDATVLDTVSSVLSKGVNSGGTQDLYEATAEISDANPCMSITIRLLSLQNKGCVCVDEIYVFADLVESTDSENEVSQMGNANGSSLMAMLTPTLLQLSKTGGLRRLENEDIFCRKGKEKPQENGSRVIEPLNSENDISVQGNPKLSNQQEVELPEAIEATMETNRHEMSSQLKDQDAKGNMSCGHIEGFLDQLVSRVNRVEDLLLKFEESMLKPISSIDARLQRVEQQLEELVKKPKHSELPSCRRIYAPEFSCHYSDNYTSDNCGNESSCHDLYASFEKDFSSSIQHDEIIYSTNANQPIPSLVVTAPEFSNADEEEDDLASASASPKAKSKQSEDDHGPITGSPHDKPKETEDDHASRAGSPKDKPKQTMSIDKALASALASFLSASSIEHQKYSQALVVEAPEFSNEDGSCEKKVSPKVASEFSSLNTTDMVDLTTASVSSNCTLSLRESAHCLNDDDSEQTTKEVVEDFETQSTCNGLVEHVGSPARHDMHQKTGEIGNGEVNSGTSKSLLLDETDILNQFLENHVDDGSDVDEKGVTGNMEIKADNKKDCQEEILQNILELSYASSVVDFETPILDVKFTSQDNSNNNSPLEAILSDMPVTYKTCCVNTSDGFQAGEECNLISQGDGEQTSPETGDHFPEDLDGFSGMPSTLEDYDAYRSKELSTESLI